MISSTILYSIWIGAAFLSMIILSVAGRRAKKRVNKGAEMWFAIGMVCFFAFLPYHLYLSMILIVIGFYYSVKKSKQLSPSDTSSSSSDKEKELPEEEEKGTSSLPSEQAIGEKGRKAEDPISPIQPEELKTLIPPPLPLERTPTQSSDPSFAPPSETQGSKSFEKDDPDPPEDIENSFLRPAFQNEPEDEKNTETDGPET